MSKACPIMLFRENHTRTRTCVGEMCAWYCEFAKQCAVPLLAGMFADSEICKSSFDYPEVKTGSWIKKEDDDGVHYVCSECKCYVNRFREAYCPNCGAKMKGNRNEKE